MPKTKEEGQIVVYQAANGEVNFNVNIFDDTVWLTQKQMSELFDTTVPNISMHLKQCFKEKELDITSTVKNFLTVQKEGSRQIKREVDHYNLDAIISIGYRVNSSGATKFRRWATSILKQHLLNGYTINEIRITKLEEKIDNLSSNLRSEFKSEIKQIHQDLLKIANRPINIYNQITNNSQLEEKAIALLDELIIKSKANNNLKSQLQETKDLIKTSPKTPEQKKKINNFFEKLGDNNSKLNKTAQGAGITNKLVKELIDIGNQIKDWFM